MNLKGIYNWLCIKIFWSKRKCTNKIESYVRRGDSKAVILILDTTGNTFPNKLTTFDWWHEFTSDLNKGLIFLELIQSAGPNYISNERIKEFKNARKQYVQHVFRKYVKRNIQPPGESAD